MMMTIGFIIYYITITGYLLTGILLKKWENVAIAITMGILGIFIMHWLREKKDTFGGEGLRISDKTLRRRI
jgi:hypothetical protein